MSRAPDGSSCPTRSQERREDHKISVALPVSCQDNRSFKAEICANTSNWHHRHRNNWLHRESTYLCSARFSCSERPRNSTRDRNAGVSLSRRQVRTMSPGATPFSPDGSLDDDGKRAAFSQSRTEPSIVEIERRRGVKPARSSRLGPVQPFGKRRNSMRILAPNLASGRRCSPCPCRWRNAHGAGGGHDQDRHPPFAFRHDGDQRNDPEGSDADAGRRAQRPWRTARQEDRGGRRRPGLGLAALCREGARASGEGQGRGRVRLLDLGVAQIGIASVRGTQRPVVLPARI